MLYFDRKYVRLWYPLNDKPVFVYRGISMQAYDWSQGRAVYVSGTAFPGVQRRDGTQFTPGQCNNCLIFPGLSPERTHQGLRLMAQTG